MYLQGRLESQNIGSQSQSVRCHPRLRALGGVVEKVHVYLAGSRCAHSTDLSGRGGDVPLAKAAPR